MKTPKRVLIVEDDRTMAEALVQLLERQGYATRAVESAEKALELLEKDPDYHVVLTDLVLPGMDGMKLLTRIKETYPQLEVVIMTGYGTIRSAVEAMKLGASDYITKPFDKDELLKVLGRIFKMKRLEQEVEELRSEIARSASFQGMVGKSKAMQEVFLKVSAAANTDAPVLIIGESGTGKELVARAIHNLSYRRQGPFVPVNCGALPKDLVESELFGYKKGAFTGAMTDSIGLFRAADGGTLFLDEIVEMSQEAQVKLLRAIEDKKIRPLGGTREIPVDVRILAATNRDIQKALDEGQFREDLFFRFVMHIEIPPLRERKEDIPILLEHFIQKFNRIYRRQVEGVEPEALEVLMSYPWHGNVRELENTVEGLYVLGLRRIIRVTDLPLHIRKRADLGVAPTGAMSIRELEKETILRALKMAGGNKSKAAKILGISRNRLYRKLKAYGLEE